MTSQVQLTHTSCMLSWLLTPLFKSTDADPLSSLSEICITGMTLDSRVINTGDLFVAVQGAISDGRTFINKATKAGASAVLSDTKEKALHGHIRFEQTIPVIEIFELNKHLSAIAMRFYFPSTAPHAVTAITGTNGKTTIASLLANSYILLGQQSAQMGTIGNGLYGQLQTSLNTTLDAISVCRELAEYQSKDTLHTIMEVSSHGLIQNRVAAIPFKTAIFTNLTRDHLDYHVTMQAYADAKKTLFTEFPLQHRIINADDDIGQTWLKEFPDAISYGFNAKVTLSTHQYFNIEKVQYLPQGVSFEFTSSWGDGYIAAPFYGDFNISNIAAVSCALLADGFSIQQIQTVIAQLTVVPGRMEQYVFKQQKLTFVVDYAHTPDALKNALQALQNHAQQGRIIAVFGCGGDRDKGKRPEMYKTAEQGADQVVIVDDNPRSENAQEIVDDIKKGLTHPEKALVIHDRKQAILHLLATANEHDIILIAGKGHEDYQIFGDKKVHYSDRECLSELIESSQVDKSELENEKVQEQKR